MRKQYQELLSTDETLMSYLPLTSEVRKGQFLKKSAVSSVEAF
jgi:hypothetical protein